MNIQPCILKLFSVTDQPIFHFLMTVTASTKINQVGYKHLHFACFMDKLTKKKKRGIHIATKKPPTHLPKILYSKKMSTQHILNAKNSYYCVFAPLFFIHGYFCSIFFPMTTEAEFKSELSAQSFGAKHVHIGHPTQLIDLDPCNPHQHFKLLVTQKVHA